jgi:hypothetical protein
MKTIANRSWYIRPDSTKLNLPSGLDEKDLVVYTGLTSYKDYPFYTLIFVGKSIKPTHNVKFKTKESRDEYILKVYLSVFKKKSEKKTKAKKENLLKVGDILVSSWGYEQTNIDFYQVIDIKGKFATVGELSYSSKEQNGYDSYMVMPKKDSYSKNPKSWIRKMVDGEYIKISSFQWAKKWDGKAKNQTTYA